MTATAGTPQSTALGAAFANALQVTVKDSNGNPVSGITVTFAAPATGPSATLSSPTAVTNASGVASVTATANNISRARLHRNGHHVGSLTASNFSLSPTRRSPAKASCHRPPAAGAAITCPVGLGVLESPFQVTVRDSNGLPVVLRRHRDLHGALLWRQRDSVELHGGDQCLRSGQRNRHRQ